MISTADRERFWANVDKTSAFPHWLWIGSVGWDGYGEIVVDAFLWRAHRLAWVLTRGEIPEAQYVLHKCDVTLCVRPFHLFTGTQLDNMRDAARKGRVRSGEQHYRAKLSNAVAAEIERRYAPERSIAEFARELAIPYDIVWRVLRGLSYKRK
jgi:HNH endonuclease